MGAGRRAGEGASSPGRDERPRGHRDEQRALIQAPPAESLPLDDLLATLPALAVEAAHADERLHERVALLKERRATWAEIGAALSVTRQAAWERFGPRASRAG